MARRQAKQTRMVAGAAICAKVTYEELQRQAEKRHLTILGGFHPEQRDGAPEGCLTLLLLGPDEPAFWQAFVLSEECQNGGAHPMDRWSSRVIGDWAASLNAIALYPFGGPPYLPFFNWAIRTGRIHASPIRLLVHDTTGLFVSFRGALAMSHYINLPKPPPSPCITCTEQPCRTTCPVAAFDGQSYDVSACKNYLNSTAGKDCMENGCAARRLCPVSHRHPRDPAQSAYHMAAFKG